MALKPLPKKAPGLSRKTKTGIAVLAVLALAGGAWGVVRSRDKKVVVPKEFTVEALQTKVAAAQADPGQMFGQMRQLRDRKDLTEQQKEVIHENMHAAWEAEQTKHINAYFAAGPAERQVMLDRDIDQHLARAKEWEQRRAQWQQDNGGAASGASSGQNAGPRGPGGPNAGANGNSAGGAPGRGRPQGGSNRQQRQVRSESRNPDLQAREREYRAAMNQRAQQRGIQLPQRGGRGG